MDELGTSHKLMDEQTGHSDGSVAARYSHITAAMTERLLTGLTEAWQAALDARWAMTAGSSVAMLDRLLAARQAELGQGLS